jgi:hypothetical protein
VPMTGEFVGRSERLGATLPSISHRQFVASSGGIEVEIAAPVRVRLGLDLSREDDHGRP